MPLAATALVDTVDERIVDAFRELDSSRQTSVNSFSLSRTCRWV